MLMISVPKATSEQVQRGLDAAIAVFKEAKVHPQDAAAGVFALEGWDISGFEGDIEDDDFTAAGVWTRAEEAALNAVCADWPEDRKRPSSAELAIVWDPETQLADRTAALAMLRERTKAETGDKELLVNKIGNLGRAVCRDIEDWVLARDLVGNLTVAYTALELSGLDKGPIEARRQAVFDAIDALEKATAPQH